jgi:hypothetical protein
VDGSRELRHGAAKHVDEDWIYRIDRILGNKVTQAFCFLGEGGWTAAESWDVGWPSKCMGTGSTGLVAT